MSKPTAPAMAVQNGLPQPKTFDELVRLSDMLARSDLVPPDYRGKPANVLAAVIMGAELGLHPLQSLQNIAVVNGRPSVWGDALLAIVMSSPLFGGIEETFDERTMTATCKVWRKGMKNPVVRTFSRADAERAGLWNKKGPWQAYPKRMLQMRARGFAIRDAFPDLLKGVITAEEARDIPAGEVVEARVVPEQDAAQQDEAAAAQADAAADLEQALQQAATLDALNEAVQAVLKAKADGVIGDAELERLRAVYRARREELEPRPEPQPVIEARVEPPIEAELEEVER